MIHDPAIFYDEVSGNYYTYSTGAICQKSKDLVHWQEIGKVVERPPQESVEWTGSEDIWAPDIVKVGKEYRLYCSNSSWGVRQSCIFLAVADCPEGPFEPKGCVLKTTEKFPQSVTNAIDANIIEDAKNHLEAKDESFEDLLTSLESSRLTIEKEQAEINAYKDEVAKLKSRLTQKEERLDERKDKVIRNAAEEAQRILREAKETADQTIKQINKLTAGAGINKELEEQRSRLRDQLKKADDKLAVKAKGPSQPISPKKLKIGDGVKVLSMNLKGTVSTLPNAKGDLYVQMGILRSLVNIKDLELLDEKEISATLGDGSSISYGGKAPAKGKGSGSSQIKVSKSSTISTEVNLIGMTVDEALPVMEKYLDDAYLAHLPSVRVVHGRGTGALKNAVHKRLRQLKYVKEFRLGQFGEGDSGVTVVTFK